MNNQENRSKIAAELFTQGYNCSQSVVGAFADKIDLDFDTLMKLSSSFGGGMGRLREVCGAVSGMFMVLGLLSGYSNPDDFEAKKDHYAAIQNLAQDFKEAHQTIVCRELLENIKTTKGSVPEKRTDEYYKARPCVRFVITATEILEKHINKSNLAQDTLSLK